MADTLRRILRLAESLSPTEVHALVIVLQGRLPERIKTNGAERQARYRARRNFVTGDVTGDVTVTAPRDVTGDIEVTGNGDGSSPSRPSPRSAQALELHGFSSFWSKYPKRVGKGDTLRSWKKNGCENRAVSIIESLEKQLPYLTREGGQFIPNPATWLNQGRWDDDPPTTLPGVSKNAQATIKNLDAFVKGKSTP